MNTNSRRLLSLTLGNQRASDASSADKCAREATHVETALCLGRFPARVTGPSHTAASPPPAIPGSWSSWMQDHSPKTPTRAFPSTEEHSADSTDHLASDQEALSPEAHLFMPSPGASTVHSLTPEPSAYSLEAASPVPPDPDQKMVDVDAAVTGKSLSPDPSAAWAPSRHPARLCPFGASAGGTGAAAPRGSEGLAPSRSKAAVESEILRWRCSPAERVVKQYPRPARREGEGGQGQDAGAAAEGGRKLPARRQSASCTAPDAFLLLCLIRSAYLEPLKRCYVGLTNRLRESRDGAGALLGSAKAARRLCERDEQELRASQRLVLGLVLFLSAKRESIPARFDCQKMERLRGEVSQILGIIGRKAREGFLSFPDGPGLESFTQSELLPLGHEDDPPMLTKRQGAQRSPSEEDREDYPRKRTLS